MSKRYLKLLLITSFLGFLSGCGLMKPADQPAPVSQVGKTSDKYEVALKKLETGNVSEAKALLESLNPTNPDYTSAQRLLAQINESPVKRYGKQSFLYKVKAGDTFGELAKRFLGNSLEFFGLARYNNIKNPRSLRIGQIIKIPGKKQAQPVPQKIQKNPAITNINQRLNQGDYKEALQLLNQQIKSPSDFKKHRLLFLEAESQLISSISNETEAEDAIKFIDSLEKNRYLAPIQTIRQNLRYLSLLYRAQNALFLEQIEKAYDYYQEALKIEVKQHPLSNEVQTELSEKMHHKAVLYYRSQDLERAIHLWDRILKINPNHESAKAYWTRATKLNAQLKNIEQED